MAITLEANYAKKLGLPNYSSHQYSVTICTELSDLSQVELESSRLYRLLQDAVDREIQETGFLPDATTYGMLPSASSHADAGGNHSANGANATNGEYGSAWACSEKQRDLILKIVSEKQLDKNHVEKLAQELFGRGVRQLDKLQASSLIEQMLERGGGNGPKANGHRQGRFPASPKARRQ